MCVRVFLFVCLSKPTAKTVGRAGIVQPMLGITVTCQIQLTSGQCVIIDPLPLRRSVTFRLFIDHGHLSTAPVKHLMLMSVCTTTTYNTVCVTVGLQRL